VKFRARIGRAKVGETEVYKPARSATDAGAPSSGTAEGSAQGLGGCNDALQLGPTWSTCRAWPPAGRWQPWLHGTSAPLTRRRRDALGARAERSHCVSKSEYPSSTTSLPAGLMHSAPTPCSGVGSWPAPAPVHGRASTCARSIDLSRPEDECARVCDTDLDHPGGSEIHGCCSSSCEGYAQVVEGQLARLRIAEGRAMRATGSC